ncbi:hypothetical protein ACFJGW_07305 [Burkholderiaceae bacterium UC74_6]
MRANVGRWVALLLWVVAGAASAQLTDITPRSDAQRLACLNRPAEPPMYPERDKYDHTTGFMRVQLSFRQPDEPPVVEVLVNTAREDMQDRVFSYLKRMRLPCLKVEDGTVVAVQEFNFRNGPIAPLPLDPARRMDEVCLVAPRDDMKWPGVFSVKQSEHIVATIAFDGDGTQPPLVRIVHSSAGEVFEDMVRNQVAKYRMPCRKAGDRPVAFQQIFNLQAGDGRRFVLKQKVFSLMNFLALTEGVRQLKADFDLNTMGCPFKLNYQIMAPALPNNVVLLGPVDPNKLAFVRWIAERRLQLDDRMANEFFGEILQVEVPCGHLKLDPEAIAKAG